MRRRRHSHPTPPAGRTANASGRRRKADAPARRPEGARTESAALHVEGQLQRKGNFGFVLSEDPRRPDVYVAGPSLRLARSGDRVRVRVRTAGARPEGDIVDVVRRARHTVTGVYQPRDGGVLLPENGDPVRLENPSGLAPRAGDLVSAHVTTWPTREAGAVARLTDVLGRRNDPAVDLAYLLHKYEWPSEHGEAARREAAAFGTEVSAAALDGRRLYFDQPVFTIDGTDAKDFDDAVSLQERPDGGWRLAVHIADVGYYVREGTALDDEARQRGTSVYLAGAVVPMLPSALSDDLCSLRPGVVRLTLTCEMDLSADGQVTAHRLFESAIRSSRRFTYDDVEEILRGHDREPDGPVRRAVLAMGRLAALLRGRRLARHSFDFDFPEPHILVDDTGWPVDARRRERGDSHRLIEEFMLLANETVARTGVGGPFLYRIHEPPDPTKLTALETTLRAVGVAVPPELRGGKPESLQKVLAAAKGRPVEAVVHTMVLRSMKQAVYADMNRGHYGLASKAYTHFTSPIRRYPDLVVHRLVRERLRGRLTEGRRERWMKELGRLAIDCSTRERTAVDMEREFLDLKRAQLMSHRVGESFTGVVVGVTSFGFFVQIQEVFVEGLVARESLAGDTYYYDATRATLRGRRTGRSFRMGQTVRVRLAAAHTDRRQLDFVLI